MNPELHTILNAAAQVILGKERALRLTFACLLARGHLLIEDLPGVGKTTLAHLIALLLGLNYQRIQFTSDMLPADIVGVSIFDRETSSFNFHPGPVFSQLVLADEINRATPKAQSALLEVMEEHQVTADGRTWPLPEPFFVVATQNPSYQIGTFPLPESQLDRFLMRLKLGYPDQQAERALLAGEDRREMLTHLQAVSTPQRLVKLQAQAAAIHVSDALLDYCLAVLEFTRNSPRFEHGLSPRAGLALLRSAKAWALLEGRDMVLPEDIQAVLSATIGHRLVICEDTGRHGNIPAVDYVLESVPIP